MKPKKTNWFFRILTFFFIIYVALFISLHTGYYEKKVRDHTLMTEEMINQFENDIQNNVVIDIKDYLPEEKDYSNVFTKSANTLSKGLKSVLDDRVTGVWNVIKSLFIS